MTAQASESPVIPEWSLGDRLRKIRRRAGHSQAEFAALLGENTKTYAAWELDTTAPRNAVALAKRVEMVTKVPAAWLLDLGVVTETYTPRFRRVTRGSRTTLRLVTGPLDRNHTVAPVNGSCPPGVGQTADRLVPRYAGTVNHADAA